MSPHAVCTKYRVIAKESDWKSSGRFLEREIERQRVCAECGAPRPVRIRRIAAIQKKAANPAPLLTHEQRALAARLATLFRQRRRLRVSALSKRLGGVRIELALENLAEAAPILLTYGAAAGHQPLEWIETNDIKGLEEIARPGAAQRLAETLASARDSVAKMKCPAAAEIFEILKSDDACELDERVIRVLAALAQLVDRAETRPTRAFSTEALGDSKALSAVRARVEHLVGPLERLGVRDNGAAVLIAGRGKIAMNGGGPDLSGYRYLGFASQDLSCASGLEAPSLGLLVVENLTAFHSCIEQLASRPVMIVWSGGFPSAGVIRVLQMAAASAYPIRIWCDLDLGGVRIARLIEEQTGGAAKPVLMSPDVVTSAGVTKPLTVDQTARIRRDLEARPNALLSETLRALLARSAWVEQEALLDLVPSLADS